jgi:hypothetical protein
MSADHPNAIAYRRTADAFRAGDVDMLAGLIAEDVTWHIPGDHSMAGDVHGRDELLVWLAALGPKGFWLSEDDVFGSDDHVCAVSMMGARRDDIDVETRVISIFRVRDGQQLERWLYPDDTTAWHRIFDD